MKHKRRLRGFTLVELSAATAVAGIIVASAASVTVLLVQRMKQMEQQTQVDQEAKLLGEFLISRLQGVGGGGVRPWFGIKVEPGPDDSEMLTWLEIDDTLPPCLIVNRPGSGDVLEANQHSDPTAPAPTDVCCLTEDFENRQLLITAQNGAGWASVYSHNVETSSCHLTLPAGLQGLGMGGYRLPGSDDDWIGGQFLAVRAYRLRIDGQHQLLFDKATTDAWESQILSDNVFDLQFALGYDADGDGNLYEDDSVDDEWLGNHADDEMGAGGLADARFSQLRMVEVGLTVGAKVPQLPAAPVQVMNGPPRSQAGYLLRATRGRAYMRNLNIFF